MTTAPLSPRARAAVLKALADAVKKAYDGDRGEADDGLRDLYDKEGVTEVEIRVPGCVHPVAKLSLTPQDGTVAVDHKALLVWCRQFHPTEVETVTTEQVRPAFVKAVMDHLKIDDDGVVSDPDTGEVIKWARAVPGGPPRTALTYTKTGRDAVAEAYRTGQLTLPQILALPAATPDVDT